MAAACWARRPSLWHILTFRKCECRAAQDEHAGIQVGCPRCQSAIWCLCRWSTGYAGDPGSSSRKSGGVPGPLSLWCLGLNPLCGALGRSGYSRPAERLSIRVKRILPFLTFPSPSRSRRGRRRAPMAPGLTRSDLFPHRDLVRTGCPARSCSPGTQEKKTISSFRERLACCREEVRPCSASCALGTCGPISTPVTPPLMIITYLPLCQPFQSQVVPDPAIDTPLLHPSLCPS